MQGCPVAALARASLSLSSLCITSGHSSAQHIALSCDWALRSASSTHASLLAAGAASNAPLASTPSPGHCCIQLRSKVYTSNAMDEERSRRIAGNFAFHKARKAWKQKMGVLKMQWLADINQSKAGEVLQDVRQHAKATVAREAQHRAVSHAAQQHTLAEQIQRAELDVEVVSLRATVLHTHDISACI